MGQLMPVINPESGQEELHPFEICSQCGRDIDNAQEGFFSHHRLPTLVLCQTCYEDIIAKGYWAADGSRVKVKGKWLNATESPLP